MTANNHHIQIAFFFVFSHVYTYTDNCWSWKKIRTRQGGDDETRFQIQFCLSWKKKNKTIPG
jgi:hypothetical protein